MLLYRFFDEVKIEYYSNVGLFILSCICILNTIYDYDYTLCAQIMKYYMIADLCFIPYNKKDMIFHHIFSIMMLEYGLHNIDFTTNFYSLKQIFLTECSSVFLSLYTIVDGSEWKNKRLKSQVVSLLKCFFICSFIKYRIYDFYKNVIVNPYFFDSIYTNTQMSYYFLRITIFSLFGLNLYWFTKLLKVIYKYFFRNISMTSAEYVLQYSYGACFLVSCGTYTFIGTDYQKTYYADYIFSDVCANFILFVSSYNFHHHIYTKLLTDPNMNRATYKYKSYLLQDVAAIQLRAIIQLYVHLKIHGLYDSYKSLLYTLISYSVLVISLTESTYFNMIYNGQILPILEVNKTTQKLDMLLGSNPFFCILLSTMGNYNTLDATNTIILLYMTFLITVVKPFYNMNHLFIHIFMMFINYYLVVNNLYERV